MFELTPYNASKSGVIVVKLGAFQQHLAISSDNLGVVAQDLLPWLDLSRIARNAGFVDALKELCRILLGSVLRVLLREIGT